MCKITIITINIKIWLNKKKIRLKKIINGNNCQFRLQKNKIINYSKVIIINIKILSLYRPRRKCGIFFKDRKCKLVQKKKRILQ